MFSSVLLFAGSQLWKSLQEREEREGVLFFDFFIFRYFFVEIMAEGGEFPKNPPVLYDFSKRTKKDEKGQKRTKKDEKGHW